jgi:hypothetical protein
VAGALQIIQIFLRGTGPPDLLGTHGKTINRAKLVVRISASFVSAQGKRAWATEEAAGCCIPVFLLRF